MGELTTGMPGLTEGRDVHFVLPDGPSAGQHRPAIVVKVWIQGYVNLIVFMDGTNDGMPPGGYLRWETSVGYDPDVKGARTWHWIEKA